MPDPAPSSRAALAVLDAEVAGCRRCPRLVAWREQVAQEKVARYRGETYWARPVPGFGDADARILVLGLAPAAHGGNRTGRVFTGDRSGDFLFQALFECGLASSPVSHRRDDGLTLTRTRISAIVHCAPPANRPTTDERDACLPYLDRELRLLAEMRVIVALGAFAWDGVLRSLATLGSPVPRPRPRFGHGAEIRVGDRWIVGLVPPEPAEHVHRPVDGVDASRRPRAGTGPGRPGLARIDRGHRRRVTAGSARLRPEAIGGVPRTSRLPCREPHRRAVPRRGSRRHPARGAIVADWSGECRWIVTGSASACGPA